MFTWPALRETILPPAQDMAASRISPSPSTVVLPSVCMTMVAMPPVASTSASHCTGCSRSPERRMASPMVKNTCTWITSDASPGEIWPFMATNNRPNWPTPISRP